MLQKQKISGVYVVPSAKSPLDLDLSMVGKPMGFEEYKTEHVWNGVVFVRQGLYQDGVFRFTVEFAANFPDSECPAVIFRPVIYHPNVDPESGKLDVTRVFPKWRRHINHVWQVLLFVRRIFLKLEIKDSLNAEAAKLYEVDNELFVNRVSECVITSRQTLYFDPDPDDPHAIRFSQWDDAIHDSAKQQMFNAKNDPSANASAITTQPFSSANLGFGVSTTHS